MQGRNFRVKSLESEIIKWYKSGHTCKGTAKKINCCVQTICRVLKRNNINQRIDKFVSNKKYLLNEKVFDKISNQEIAYLLGFIYADGNICKNNLSISLVRGDKKILEKFNTLFETNKPLIPIPAKGKDKPQFKLLLSNKYMAEKLKSLGVIERKSLVVTFPLYLKPKLYQHFIRGYFDGDGSIGIKKNLKDYRLSFCGTSEFLYGIQKILNMNLGVHFRKLYRKKSLEVNSYSLDYNGRIQVEIIMDWLYKKATIFLIRKKEKYDQAKTVVNKNVIKKHHRTTLLKNGN